MTPEDMLGQKPVITLVLTIHQNGNLGVGVDAEGVAMDQAKILTVLDFAKSKLHQENMRQMIDEVVKNQPRLAIAQENDLPRAMGRHRK